MKKAMRIGIFLMLTLLLFGCNSTTVGEKKGALTPTPTEKALTITPVPTNELGKRVIEIAIEQYPPFNYQENGTFKGVSFDVMKEAFHRMGVELKVSQYPWARILQLIRDGEIDAIMTVYKSKEREEYMYFPEEAVSEDVQTFYVKEGSKFFYTDKKSLTSIKLGIMRGYSYGDEFDQSIKKKEFRTEAVDSQEQNIKKLLNNRIDAFLESNYVTAYNLNQMGIKEGIVAAGQFRVTKLYVTFTKKRNISQADLDGFDKAVKSIKDDGTYQKIVDQYLNQK